MPQHQNELPHADLDRSRYAIQCIIDRRIVNTRLNDSQRAYLEQLKVKAALLTRAIEILKEHNL